MARTVRKRGVDLSKSRGGYSSPAVLRVENPIEDIPPARALGLGPEFDLLVIEYQEAIEADRASTLRLNEARRALIEHMKAHGLEKLFHL